MTCLPERQHYRKHKDSPESRCVESAPMIPGWKYYYSLIHGHTTMAPTNFLRTFLGHFLRVFHHIRHFKNSHWCKIGVLMENAAQKPSVFKALRVLYIYCRGTQKVSLSSAISLLKSRILPRFAAICLAEKNCDLSHGQSKMRQNAASQCRQW